MRPILALIYVMVCAQVSVATIGLLWPTGVEPGDPSVSEAPSGKRSWWVDADAPAGGNGTFASPFNSFEVVESSMRGGDFVYVRGTFEMANNSPAHQMTLNFYRAQASGTAAEPTTLKSWRGSPRAVFSSNRTDAQVRASNNGGIRFQNIEIRNFGDQGIVIGDGVLFADIVNIVAHDGQVTSGSGVGGGLVMYAEDSLHAFTVRNCLFYDTAGPNPGNNTGAFTVISEPAASLGSTVVVRDNYFHDNYVSIRHKHAGRVHMEAYNNRIEDCSIGFYLRMWSSEVHHNLFVRNRAAIKLETDNMNANHDYRIHHNTFYDTDWLAAAMPDQGGFVATLHIESNIFMDPSGGLGVIQLGSDDWNWGSNDISSWTMANNVFSFAPAGRNFLYSPPPTTALAQSFTASLAQLGDTTSKYADPLFTNAVGGDFTLQPNSPAMGLGFEDASSIPNITVQPVDQTVVTGSSVTFVAAANGTPQPTIQWRRNGSVIPAATNSSYTIVGVSLLDAGSYTVLAASAAGSATSNTATLQVIPGEFNFASYYARNPEPAAAYGANQYAAWLYFRNQGVYNGETFDDLFRVEEYLALYPELLAIFGSDLGGAVEHWLTTGKFEGRLGRIPSGFSAAGYFARNPDVALAVGNDPVLAWQHFWLYGIYEGRAFDDEFRAFEYLAINADLTAAFVNDWRQATLHWLRYGSTEGRLGRLPLIFNATEYLNRNPDVAATWGTNPTTDFLHFWLYGVEEGRAFDDAFRAEEYLALNPDLLAVFGTDRRGAFKHWVRYGMSEGRQGRNP